jgi:5,10-methenyltetrahydromethanopterin hydrogenase
MVTNVESAWDDMVAAVMKDDWQAAGEIADRIVEWLARGANPPALTGKRAFDRYAVDIVAHAVSSWETV